MAACETCWARAQSDALMLGGSVVDRYRQRIEELRENPTHPSAEREQPEDPSC